MYTSTITVIKGQMHHQNDMCKLILNLNHSDGAFAFKEIKNV